MLFWCVNYNWVYNGHIMVVRWPGCATLLEDRPSNIMYDHKLTCLSWIIYNKSSWYVLDHYVVRMLMGCHQYSIMLVQLQGNIIADIEAYYNIILMYGYNVYHLLTSFLMLCPALRTASPRVPVHCLPHIFLACSLSPPCSWSACSPCQSCIKDILWSS